MTQLTLESVRQYTRLRRAASLRRDRGRAHGGAAAGARAPDVVREGVGHRRRQARHAGRGQGARAVHRRVGDPRRLLLAGRRGRRLAALRHDRARARGRVRRAHGGSERRGARARCRGRPHQARAHRPRRRRGRVRRDLLRRLEPAARADGGRVDPAHAGRPPDDRHRPGAAVHVVEDGRRFSDRPRHGHEHVRAPGRAGARGRLVRAPRDPARAGRDPVDRGVGALADRAAVHAGRLHAADGARARADARDRRTTRAWASSTRSTACCR